MQEMLWKWNNNSTKQIDSMQILFQTCRILHKMLRFRDKLHEKQTVQKMSRIGPKA